MPRQRPRQSDEDAPLLQQSWMKSWTPAIRWCLRCSTDLLSTCLLHLSAPPPLLFWITPFWWAHTALLWFLPCFSSPLLSPFLALPLLLSHPSSFHFFSPLDYLAHVSDNLGLIKGGFWKTNPKFSALVRVLFSSGTF